MNIVVIGGGTAGSIAALLLKNNFPEHEVISVISSAIGTVGPGEGTTPLIKTVLDELNISEAEFLEYGQGTRKLGIVFKNWNRDGIDYLQPFSNPIKDTKIFKNEESYCRASSVAIKLKHSLDLLNPQSLAAKNKMIPIDKSDYPDLGYHIDSSKLVQLFHSTMIERGIKIIDDIVVDLKTDLENNIKTLILQSGNTLNCDLVIDSSGFKRLLIGKHYNENFINLKKQLPIDRAIAAILPIDEFAGPYTESIALDYGWSWKIPLQHRYGCGYAYDSSYITDEQAEEELRKLYGNDLQIVNRFKFESGFFENVLVKNCLAIGLASGFFEPLEATSIDGTIFTIQNFIKTGIANKILNGKETNEDRHNFNNRIMQTNRRIATFLFMHYITNKTNTKFWTEFRNKNSLQTDNAKIFDHMIGSFNKNKINKDIMNEILQHGFDWFELSTWYTVYAGNGNINIEEELDNNILIEYNSVIQKVENVMKNNFKPIYKNNKENDEYNQRAKKYQRRT